MAEVLRQRGLEAIFHLCVWQKDSPLCKVGTPMWCGHHIEHWTQNFVGSQAVHNSFCRKETARTSILKPGLEPEAITFSHYIPEDLHFPDLLFHLSHQSLLWGPTYRAYRELKHYFLSKREHLNINLNIKDGRGTSVTWTETGKRTPFMPLALSWSVSSPVCGYNGPVCNLGSWGHLQ